MRIAFLGLGVMGDLRTPTWSRIATGFKLSLLRKEVDITCALVAEKGLAPKVSLRNKRMWREAETALGPRDPVTAMVRHTYAKSAGNPATLAQNT